MLIREAEHRDAAAIAGLLGQLGYAARAEEIPGRLERMAAEPGQHILVADDGDQLVGLATVIIRHVINDDAPFARLASLVVLEGRRGQGIGRALVERAAWLARQAGCNLMEVTSGDHRPRAHEFYRLLGFEERPRRFTKRF